MGANSFCLVALLRVIGVISAALHLTANLRSITQKKSEFYLAEVQLK